MTSIDPNTTEAPQTDFVERRRVPRLRSLLTGTLIFDDNSSTMDCTVRNISAYGAKMVITDAFRLPEAFNLRIPHHDQTHRARIAWRKGDEAGLTLSDVHATQHHEHHKVTPREAARLRRKELDAPMF
jgi:hypothetical protein